MSELAPLSGFAAQLRREISACRACAEDFSATKTGHAPRPVLQIGPSARLCVAGQAPGWKAHLARRPFSDPSGDRLREWMAIDSDAFYDPCRLAILPMAFCFPGHDPKGGDRPPPRRCADLWRDRLFDAHPNIETVLLVGGAAQRWHLGSAFVGVTETVRAARAIYAGERGVFRPGVRFLPLPHPSWRNTAWLKRNPWFEAETLPFVRECISKWL